MEAQMDINITEVKNMLMDRSCYNCGNISDCEEAVISCERWTKFTEPYKLNRKVFKKKLKRYFGDPE
jgi:hypothetical protein